MRNVQDDVIELDGKVLNVLREEMGIEICIYCIG